MYIYTTLSSSTLKQTVILDVWMESEWDTQDR